MRRVETVMRRRVFISTTLSTLACCAWESNSTIGRLGGWSLKDRQALCQEGTASTESIVRHFDFRNYRVRQVAKLTNVNAQLTQLDVWLPIARTDREQRVGEVELIAPARQVTERYAAGNLARHLSTESLPKSGESVEIVVEYPVQVARVETDIDRLRQFTWKGLESRRIPERFLRREKLIATDEPRIVEKSQALREQTKGPGLFARAAYDWVLDQLQYRKRPEPIGVADCLDAGVGECSEYSAIFVALCRAAGIPARPAVGFRLNGARNAWHVWAEFMLPNGDWAPVDGASGDGSERQRDSHFGTRDNQLVAVMKAFEVELELASREYRKLDYLQSGVCWWRGRNVQAPPVCEFSAVGTAATE